MTRLLSAVTALTGLSGIVSAGVTSVPILNPSFQADLFAAGVGYAAQNSGAITGWSISNPGGIGLNGSDFGYPMHFSDGTTMDSTRLAFIQGNGSVSQNVSGLVAGQRYVFQGWFKQRECCGGLPVLDVSYGGQPLVSGRAFSSGQPWQAVTASFIAGSSSGALSINSTVPAGDGSLAFDNIQLFRLDPNAAVILNPSFEAGTSFDWPGYQGAIAGWTKTGPGGFGYNYAGNSPFADNGTYPEGSTVAFIQNDGAISQDLTSLTVGQQYRLELDYNSRNDGDDGHIRVTLGGATLLDSTIAPVGGANPWYRLSALWTATSASPTLSIAGILDPGKADASIVFDNISLTLVPVPEPASVFMAATGLLLAGWRRRSAVQRH